MRMGDADPYASSDDDTPAYRVSLLSSAPLLAQVVLMENTVPQAKKIGEVEVEPGFSHTQQMGIAITCLIETGKLPLIEVVKDVSTRSFVRFTT